MPITDKLVQLGDAARKLNDGSDYLNRLIARIDKVLGRLMIGMDYVHPRPMAEQVTADRDGKRVIELAYLGYLKVQGGYHLAVKNVKILESKAALANEMPGKVIPLLSAPRMLRHLAADQLPEVVTGLAKQVDDVVNAMERRCATAEALLQHLEHVAAGSSAEHPIEREPEPKPEPTGPRKTVAGYEPTAVSAAAARD